MTGENGTPATPDWQPHPAAIRCTSCHKITVYCEATEGCCAECTHYPEPMLWQGDQA